MLHLVLSLLAALPSCWSLYDAALAHSAAAPHPKYVSYSERIAVTEDGESLLSSNAHIDYRDDGIARVADERFSYDPYVTRSVEPGPPELGPYGPGRAMWLPLDPGTHTIAAVRAKGRVECTLEGVDTYRSHPVFHLVFSGANPARSHLDEVWIDVHSHDIWKLHITGPLRVLDDPSASGALADYEIELGYQGAYLVVDRVMWSYDRRIASERARYSAEYTFSGFSFPRELPSAYFALTP